MWMGPLFFFIAPTEQTMAALKLNIPEQNIQAVIERINHTHPT